MTTPNDAPHGFEQYEARRHAVGHPSDSYRHDAENDGLPLTTGGQYDEIGWLLFLGIGAAVIAAVFFAAGAVLL